MKDAKILFFFLEWSKLPEKKARATMDYPEFEHYRHYLDTR